MQKRTNRHLGILVIAAILSLVAACGGSDSNSSPGGAHNNADVSFATDMIPHHSQAVEMADFALTQAKSPQVVALAKQIKGAQDPEIAEMTNWLKSWDEPIPDTGMGSMDGMEDSSMPGMMSTDDMKRLGSSSGAGFDRMWLQMMTAHHEGAVEMSKAELKDGKSADAKALAQKIIDAQEAEIATMQGLLK